MGVVHSLEGKAEVFANLVDECLDVFEGVTLFYTLRRYIWQNIHLVSNVIQGHFYL